MLRKIYFHLLFWLIALNLCAFIIGYQADYKQAYFLMLIYSPVMVGTAYFISGILIKQYFLEKRYLRFFLYLVYTLIVSFFLVMILNTLVFIFVANYSYNLMPPATKDIVTLFTILYLVIFLFVSTDNIKAYSEAFAEKEVAKKRLAEAELKFLKSQLNPHFLFNTLNNLYSLSLKKADETPEAILKLSNLLDHILNASDKLLIPLSEEIKVLNDFIYLESLRYGSNLKLISRIELAHKPSFEIPPLTLVTIVENCFKHASFNKENKLFISIEIMEIDNKFKMTTLNDYDSQITENKAGRGLENLKRQLNYLFDGRFSLTTIKEKKFVTTLEIYKP